MNLFCRRSAQALYASTVEPASAGVVSSGAPVHVLAEVHRMEASAFVTLLLDVSTAHGDVEGQARQGLQVVFVLSASCGPAPQALTPPPSGTIDTS